MRRKNLNFSTLNMLNLLCLFLTISYSFVILSLQTLHVEGLSCYSCPRRAFNQQCRERKKCGPDQTVCSYSVENSHSGPSQIERRCEQAESCQTDNKQNSNFKNSRCKYCCLGDNCNTNGPKRCEKGTGVCTNPVPRDVKAPVVFCRIKKNLNMFCASQEPYHNLMNSTYFYIANSTAFKEVAGCRKKKTIQPTISPGDSVMSIIELECVRVETRNKRSLLKLLKKKNFRIAKNYTRINNFNMTCDKFIIEDYRYDWKCQYEDFVCSFLYTPPPVTIVNAPVAAGIVLDTWMYILMVIAVGGVLLSVGFARNIIRAVKNRSIFGAKPRSVGPRPKKTASRRPVHIAT